jgi:hypothetical protein
LVSPLVRASKVFWSGELSFVYNTKGSSDGQLDSIIINKKKGYWESIKNNNIENL